MNAVLIKTSVLLLALAILILAACSSSTSPSNSNALSGSELASELPPNSESMQIDLTDLDGLAETYLTPIVFSAATRHSWTDANAIEANILVDMYGYMKIWNANISKSDMEIEDNISYYYLDEAVLEDYVQGYFDLSIDHLHSSDRYKADRKAYSFNMSGVGWAYNPQVLRAEHDKSTNILVLYLDDGFGEIEGEAAILTIQLSNDGSFKYISNSVLSAESANLTDEQVFAMFQNLDEKGRAIYFWYTDEPYGGNEYSLEVASEWKAEESEYQKVGKFKTIEEMKAATEEVFTEDFCNAVFYEHAFSGDTPMYKEINGELHRNTDQGGTGWPWILTDQHYIPYRDDKIIVIEAKTLLPEDEVEWNHFVLKKTDGGWRIDIFYEMNPHMQWPNALHRQREKEIRGAVSSWLVTSNWTDSNQLEVNQLLNLYLYNYCEGKELKYDYEKGYEVSSTELIEALSAYLKEVNLETLKTANQLEGHNATYDPETDNFYFFVSYDPADYIVLDSKTKGNTTTLEVMAISKGGDAACISHLDLEVDGNNIKFVGNRIATDFRM